MRGLALTVGATLLISGSFLPQAEAEPAAVRVVDRTFTCSTLVRAGVRLVEASAVAGLREPATPSQWRQLANASLRTGFGSPLASVSAGVPSGVPGGYTFAVGAQVCRAAKDQVSLSAQGLSGGSVDWSGGEFQCTTPKKIVVRIRAVFRSATSLRLDRATGLLLTATPVREARIAARTQDGKRLAYAEVFESGKARVFAARTCEEE